jgi:hypothetical protein
MVGIPISLHYQIWVKLKLGLPAGNYTVGEYEILLDYPSSAPGRPRPYQSQNQDIVRFDVKFTYMPSRNEQEDLRSTLLFQVLYDGCLDALGKLLTSVKLVSAGTAFGTGPRQIGRSDVLAMYGFSDGSQKISQFNFTTVALQDPFATKYAALSDEYRGARFAIAMRLLRCMELSGVGFHTEAFLVAFSVLDDTVQTVVKEVLESRGLTESEVKEVVFGIRESRLRRMLGHTLKMTCQIDIETVWAEVFRALAWTNTTRNRLSHAGQSATIGDASACLYVVERILGLLKDFQLLDFEIPHNFRRGIHMACSTARPRQDWFPDAQEIQQTMDTGGVVR